MHACLRTNRTFIAFEWLNLLAVIYPTTINLHRLEEAASHPLCKRFFAFFLGGIFQGLNQKYCTSTGTYPPAIRLQRATRESWNTKSLCYIHFGLFMIMRMTLAVCVTKLLGVWRTLLPCQPIQHLVLLRATYDLYDFMWSFLTCADHYGCMGVAYVGEALWLLHRFVANIRIPGKWLSLWSNIW